MQGILRRWPAVYRATAAIWTLPNSICNRGLTAAAEEKSWYRASYATLHAASAATSLTCAALLWPTDTTCEAQPHLYQPQVVHSAAAGAGPKQSTDTSRLGAPDGGTAVAPSGTARTSWVPAWLSWLWGSGRPAPDNQFLRAVGRDPRVAVVMAFALPSLSLSFGYVPPHDVMEAAAALVSPHLAELRAWEVAVLLWGAARLGYHPGDDVMKVATSQLAQALAVPFGNPGALAPQEAAMVGWALAAMDHLTPELWADVNTFLGGCPAVAVDEVALIHLYQAALFADRHAVTAPAHPLAPITAVPADTPPRTRAADIPLPAAAAAAHLPRLRSPSQEVRATLAAGGCPLPLINRCEQVYQAAAGQPGFDGPALIELSMIHLLIRIYQEGGGSPQDSAYSDYFHDLNMMDLQHAQQLLADPYLTTKFKREVADKRARQNNFTRQLADISRTLSALGVYHVTQAAVEDGLVHVDIALPDYKVAFFLEGAERGGGRRGVHQHAGGGGAFSALGTEGVVLSGYVANETPGSKAAKLRLLQRLGWVVLPIQWVQSVEEDKEKRATLLALLDKAGGEQLMRGRVSSVLHGALRGAEESDLGGGRFQRASAGQYITRQR